MNKTQSTHDHTTKSLSTTGEIVKGFKAKYYDIGNTPLGLPLVTLPHVRLLNLEPDQSLLDIGSGTGEVLYRLYKKYGETVSLYGIDPSDDMLDVARYKLRKATNIHMKLGIGEQLQFPDASFDWVVSSLTFHHVPLEIKRATIRESYRVLKPGGHILISDFGAPTTFIARVCSPIWVDHAFTSENYKSLVQKLLVAQGFTELSDTVVAGLIHHTLARK